MANPQQASPRPWMLDLVPLIVVLLVVSHKVVVDSEKTSNHRHKVLSLEFLLPIVQHADFLLREAVEVGDDVAFVLAHLGERAAGVLAGEDAVRAAGAVEGLAGGYVVNLAADCHIDRLRWVGAVVVFQLLWSELH
ncbi:PTS system fructose-specific IIC component [Striga asiatica]|uniref:PTS system fructose-specific IIC component n=1 Tax=Striga asiatica TaxID=4170 RepID=A0A5A7PI50_STRAF|nr:PTS system fructose-specific IIC component [Striga asiatica]